MKTLLDNLTREDSETRLDLQKGDDVAVIVNNLGCTSELEMGILRREAVVQLSKGSEMILLLSSLLPHCQTHTFFHFYDKIQPFHAYYSP